MADLLPAPERHKGCSGLPVERKAMLGAHGPGTAADATSSRPSAQLALPLYDGPEEKKKKGNSEYRNVSVRICRTGTEYIGIHAPRKNDKKLNTIQEFIIITQDLPEEKMLPRYQARMFGKRVGQQPRDEAGSGVVSTPRRITATLIGKQIKNIIYYNNLFWKCPFIHQSLKRIILAAKPAWLAIFQTDALCGWRR